MAKIKYQIKKAYALAEERSNAFDPRFNGKSIDKRIEVYLKTAIDQQEEASKIGFICNNIGIAAYASTHPEKVVDAMKTYADFFKQTIKGFLNNIVKNKIEW